MLFQYAQNSTDYALTYAPSLHIMLKLHPLFLDGANLYVHITLNVIQLHCQSQTRPRHLLGDLHADYMDHVLFQRLYHLAWDHSLMGTRYFTV